MADNCPEVDISLPKMNDNISDPKKLTDKQWEDPSLAKLKELAKTSDNEYFYKDDVLVFDDPGL